VSIDPVMNAHQKRERSKKARNAIGSLVLVVFIFLMVGGFNRFMAVYTAGWDWDCFWVQCRKIIGDEEIRP